MAETDVKEAVEQDELEVAAPKEPEEPRIYQSAEYLLDSRIRLLREALTARAIIDKLPPLFKDLRVTGVEYNGWYTPPQLVLSIHADDKPGQEGDVVKQLKMLGVTGLATKKTSWDKDGWYAEGDMALETFKVKLTVWSVPPPIGCEVKQVRKMNKVWVGICQETGKRV